MNVHDNRLIRAETSRALREKPVVVITGPRHAAKTPMVRGIAELRDFEYRTLDDLETLETAACAPASVARGSHPIIVDEIQRCPSLISAAVGNGEASVGPARFVAIGSADVTSHCPTAAAAAVAFTTVWPLTRREQHGRAEAGSWTRFFESPATDWPEIVAAESGPAEDWRILARRGGYPTPVCELASEADRDAWFRAYERTYLEKDVRELAPMASIVDVRRVQRAAARRVGTIANQTEIARDAGLSQPTVFRHLQLLESTYQVIRVHGHAGAKSRRALTTPKLYWSDSALALHLAAEREPRRAHFENVVLVDLVAWRGAERSEPEIRYFRPVTGAEVEFVVAWRDRVLPIAIRASVTPRFGDGRGIAEFRAERGDEALCGLLLHEGDETCWLRDGVLAAPWWRVL